MIAYCMLGVNSAKIFNEDKNHFVHQYYDDIDEEFSDVNIRGTSNDIFFEAL